MVQDAIIFKSGKINEYLHLIDLRWFGMRRVLTCFLCEFDDGVIVLDCGSSIEVKRVWRYAKRNNIPLSSVKYLIPSQHHFDHAGGMWMLYEKVRKHNPEVKILTNQKTKELFNDFEHHLGRAKRTYKEFVGTMEPIEDDAFRIIEPSSNFSPDPNSLDFIETFHKDGKEIKLAILKTPGHTPDHSVIALVKDNEIDFLHSGEAIGTLYHTKKLVSMPTSMPVYFNYKDFMSSLDNLMKLKTPLKIGMGHSGVINGKNNVRFFMLEHKDFLKDFRSKVKQYYHEKPETEYVLKKLTPDLEARTDTLGGNDKMIFSDIILGVIYGMMVDLGYRVLDDIDIQMIERFQD